MMINEKILVADLATLYLSFSMVVNARRRNKSYW